jgi:hypothetical protein
MTFVEVISFIEVPQEGSLPVISDPFVYGGSGMIDVDKVKSTVGPKYCVLVTYIEHKSAVMGLLCRAVDSTEAIQAHIVVCTNVVHVVQTSVNIRKRLCRAVAQAVQIQR